MKSSENLLVFAECNKEGIHPVAFELLAKGKELCEKSGSALHCLVLGNQDTEILDLQELNIRGADEVFYIKDDCFTWAEECLYKENIVPFIRERNPHTVLFGATNFGRSLAPRVAAALQTGLTADCTNLTMDEDGRLIQIRPAFSNNILAHIKTLSYPQIATIRYKEFQEAERDEAREAKLTVLEAYRKAYEGATVLESLREQEFDITKAEVVVSGGRGIKRKEDLQMLQELAELLGGELGVSRALVDGGMISSAHQIGYSGNRVKPKVYIACGISGAPQHIAGMKDADLIIAINKDPSAPIFKFADYGYVGNLYEVIPQMISGIKNGVQGGEFG
ncbi:electron transfer flavoprotein subunit alpha/FixB family protein [Aminipila butyrica]|uniref:Electron transfer flavoprotein subunit alpha/FixB family protein n=1 Tax=Aminipila butyrica TaxID=433296 RepID=A0A858BV25_9FIRM|nr:electron transfer flavoprotein subunit alpha/FixB family protein [Aminipila butyrica]QIB68905.1 electron transfer flavoprotein subunit alpha/FixB family protein [Aminipila butyrica]